MDLQQFFILFVIAASALLVLGLFVKFMFFRTIVGIILTFVIFGYFFKGNIQADILDRSQELTETKVFRLRDLNMFQRSYGLNLVKYIADKSEYEYVARIEDPSGMGMDIIFDIYDSIYVSTDISNHSTIRENKTEVRCLEKDDWIEWILPCNTEKVIRSKSSYEIYLFGDFKAGEVPLGSPQ